MPTAARHRRTRPPRHRVRECARLGGIPATYTTSYIDSQAQSLIDQINATLQVWQTPQTNWNIALSQTHTRDALGRITQTQETLLAQGAPTKSYTYDLAGRLTSATVGGLQTTWGYDLNGNRIAENGNVIATYDSEDRLQSWKGNTYTYNAAGDLASKTTPAGTTSYTYDAQGSLRKVVLANGKTITYAIDPAGRRTGKTVNGALQWQLVWISGLKPLARLKPNNTLDQTYYYGGKPNVPEAMTTSDGKTYRIISDQIGSVRLVIDAQSGEVAQQIDYDTWGQVTNDTNPGFQPFGFAGGLYDPDTGLTRFGARDYDAETGRWTAKDPILFGGGDSNLYGYVAGDPVNWIDPDGLKVRPDSKFQPNIDALRDRSPLFKKYYDILDGQKAIYYIKEIQSGGPCSASGSISGFGNYTIEIPKNIDQCYCSTYGNGAMRFSTERAIVHELLHPALGKTDADHSELIKIENQIMKQFDPNGPDRNANDARISPDPSKLK